MNTPSSPLPLPTTLPASHPHPHPGINPNHVMGATSNILPPRPLQESSPPIYHPISHPSRHHHMLHLKAEHRLQEPRGVEAGGIVIII